MPLKDSVGTVTLDVGTIADGKAVKRNGAAFEGFDAAAATHTHAQADITGTAVVTTDPRLSDARTPTAHAHVIGDTTGLQTALDGKAAASHGHAAGDITPVTVNCLLGRGSAAGNGAAVEIALGTNLSMSGTTLNAAGGGGGAWTTVKKTADQPKTDNVLAADSALTVVLAGATRYTIRGTVYLLVQNASADVRYDLNYSGSWTTVYCKDSRNIAGVAAGTDNVTVRIASALPASTDVLATVTGIVIVEFELTGLTNAGGTFAFRFAQVTNNASATLSKAGGYLEYASF